MSSLFSCTRLRVSSALQHVSFCVEHCGLNPALEKQCRHRGHHEPSEEEEEEEKEEEEDEERNRNKKEGRKKEL